MTERFKNLKKKKEILKVGVAFDEQEINKVPIEKFDKKLDLIITQKGWSKVLICGDVVGRSGRRH